MNSRSWLASALLLLLTLIYLGSYFALFDPGWRYRNKGLTIVQLDGTPVDTRTGPYRCGDKAVATIFWPIAQIDSRLRPHLWDEVPWEE